MGAKVCPRQSFGTRSLSSEATHAPGTRARRERNVTRPPGPAPRARRHRSRDKCNAPETVAAESARRPPPPAAPRSITIHLLVLTHVTMYYRRRPLTGATPINLSAADRARSAALAARARREWRPAGCGGAGAVSPSHHLARVGRLMSR